MEPRRLGGRAMAGTPTGGASGNGREGAAPIELRLQMAAPWRQGR